MVEARRALLHALHGDAREARASCLSYANKADCDVQYIEAWSRIFLGWAQRLLGLREESRSCLEYSREFFARVNVPAGKIHCELELLALEGEAGKAGRARKRLKALRARTTCGRGALKNPMLSARLLAYQVRLILQEPDPDYREAASLLVEAESYLAGHRYQDLEILSRDLRRRLRREALPAPESGGLSPDLFRDPAQGLELLESFLDPVADLLKRIEVEIGEERAGNLQKQLDELKEHLQESRRALEEKPSSPPVHPDSIVGSSDAMQQIRTLVRQVAASTLPVLVRGETGTGKELVARAIHGESSRREAPFVTVNCGAIPRELLEAELLGYSRGAFTGAEKDRPGLLLSAQGGTFLFDEIAELPLELQGKLLRILDGRRIRPLGSSVEVELDVRFLSASSRDLGELIREGKFRGDLFYRLNTFEMIIPPLRERLEDLPELVEHFRVVAGGEIALPAFDEDALRALAAHSWPGNIRELRTIIIRLALKTPERIRAEDVRALLGETPARGMFPPALLRSRPLDQLRSLLEKEYLVQLHSTHGGDLKAMAAHLGITLQGLYKRLKALGIRPRELPQ